MKKRATMRVKDQERDGQIEKKRSMERKVIKGRGRRSREEEREMWKDYF
jgi:hypothetical protein